MTINSWGELTNKRNGNIDSCFDHAWQLPVFLFLVRLPPHRLPSAPDRGGDLRCDWRALRATDRHFAA